MNELSTRRPPLASPFGTKTELQSQSEPSTEVSITPKALSNPYPKTTSNTIISLKKTLVTFQTHLTLQMILGLWSITTNYLFSTLASIKKSIFLRSSIQGNQYLGARPQISVLSSRSNRGKTLLQVLVGWVWIC
jgi:hypothetical protein